ncbi:MAG: GNAT family N-acetyltransferase [Tannerellaceae bacterium]|nr:GNAT family N-acetyltransferase [Tannerellaceae bacterium]
MEIRSQLLNSKDQELLDKIEETYNHSFPTTERRDFSLVKELLEEEPLFSLYALLQDNLYVGFISIWDFNSFIYIEHFAIDQQARNGGIGRIALQKFIAQVELPIILEVELPEEEMSKRRIGFYERIGFSFCNIPYFQPPYRKGETNIELRLMSYGEIDLCIQFENVRNLVYRHVYGLE